jgi:hypothetical protein
MTQSLIVPAALLAIMTVCLGVMGYFVIREVARRVRRPR